METQFAVQQVDYPSLVSQMATAGIEGMGDVLFAKLGALGEPKFRNEIRYFWAALFNAAKANDVVWLWLCTAPHIRQFAPPEAQHHTLPQFASDISLPVIGGPDDEPFQAIERVKQYSAESTDENFLEQAAALDAHLRDEGQKRPSVRCKTIEQYVETFYYSGTGQMMAQVQLTEAGFHALATREGISYLMATYPPVQQ